MADFNRCIGPVIIAEGGYVNDPDDPGGETRYGVSKRAFPDVDIRMLTLIGAIDIYRHFYWTKYNLDLLTDSEKALHLFDFIVNAGPGRAIRTAQRLYPGLTVDGKLGPLTAAEINADNDFVNKYKHARKVFYEYLADKYPRNRKFLRGWLRRVNELKL